METICLQCGDAGWDNAFVDCVRCLKFSVHRYCLDKIPEKVDEIVDWECDYCKDEAQKQTCETLGKKKSSEDVPLKNLVKNQKKKRRFEQPCNEKEHRSLGGNSSAKQSHKKRKNVDTRDRPLVSPMEKQGFNVGDKRRVSEKSHESDKDKGKRKDHVSSCNRSADGSKKLTDTALPLQDNVGLDLDIQRNKESDKVIRSDIYKDGDENITTNEVRADFATSPTVNHGEDFLEDSEDGNAHPIAIPIWSGDFRISKKDRSNLYGVVAHLSDRACEQVYSTACEFQRVIHFEMHPKAQVWPKSFETVEPSGESIALYFFASETSANVFDQLVKDMITEQLALKAVLGAAELLVFTSIELPLRYWRFQGKFYLWGVFRGKRRDPPDSGSDGRAIELHKALPKDDDDGSNRRKSSSKSKGCTKAQSPLSTLSNSASCGTEEV